MKTENKYEYQPVNNLNLQGVDSITFTIKACNDAHISLQPAVGNVTKLVSCSRCNSCGIINMIINSG